MRVLMVGSSRGLGLGLAKIYRDKGADVACASRTDTEISGVRKIYLDVTNLTSIRRALEIFENSSLDLVVYCPSLWGESGALKATELANFIAVGPVGLLALVDCLKERKLLGAHSTFVSIGSTAVGYRNKSRNPCYALAKLLQSEIVARLAHESEQTSTRYINIELGTLGEEAGLISTEDVYGCIEELRASAHSIHTWNVPLRSWRDL